MSERKVREKIVRPNADEQYLLFQAAKKLLESGCVTNFTEYPTELMQTIDVIRPIALSGFLIHQVYPANYHKIYADPDYREPEIIKPVMLAIFGDIPGFTQKIADMDDEANYYSLKKYCDVFDERYDFPGLFEAYVNILCGSDMKYTSGEENVEDIIIDSKEAIKRAALTVEIQHLSEHMDMIDLIERMHTVYLKSEK